MRWYLSCFAIKGKQPISTGDTDELATCQWYQERRGFQSSELELLMTDTTTHVIWAYYLDTYLKTSIIGNHVGNGRGRRKTHFIQIGNVISSGHENTLSS